MIECFTLSNSIRVVCENIPYLRSVSIGVWVNVGSANETVENNGISHVIEHMLFKGTKTKNAKQIADITAALGGNVNAFTSKEGTSFFVRTLDVNLCKAMELLGDMILNSVIDEKDLDKEKSVIADEIDMYEDSAEDMVHEMLQKVVWKNHPLGYIISGEKETVYGFTREQVLEFKNQYYTGENIVISIASNYDPNKIKYNLEKYFKDIPKQGKNSIITIPEYYKTTYKKSKDIEQVHLDIAFNAINNTSEERYAFSVANSIIGGSVNSRLFQRIREELGLVYSIYSYGCSFNNAGLFQIYAAMNPNQLNKVIEETNNLINDMKSNKISNEELHNAKEEIITELIIGSESTQNRMENNAKSIIQFGHIIDMEETIKEIENVSNDMLESIIDKYLNVNNASMAIIGNI